MTTTPTVGAAATAGTADDPTGATVPAPTEEPLRIVGDLAERLAGTSRWQL